jgi:hypothetical protein
MASALHVPRWQRHLYLLIVLVLLVSGFGQMPIFKRYYIADVPGLGWTADFYVTHLLHYLAAGVFLLLVFAWLGQWLVGGRGRLSALGWARAALLAGIVVSGFMRVAKNFDSWHWSPTTTLLIDWGHLLLVMLLGGVALARVLQRSLARRRTA